MPPSIASNSFARLFSDVIHMAMAFGAGIITARWFGPGGKGGFAALVSLITVFGHASTLGLGDAGVILIGKGEATAKRMISYSIVPIVLSSVLGAGGLWLVANLQLASKGPTLGRSITVAAITVPVIAFLHFLGFILNAHERITATSLVKIVIQVLNLGFVVVLVIFLERHITGGILAGLLASLIGLGVVVSLLRRMEISFHPRWNPRFVWKALRYGLVIEGAQTLLILAARVDVLFVYSLAGRSAAGRYSVALTVGQLVTFAASALSFALFPRVARLDEQKGVDLVARASRVGLATSLMSGVVLVVAIPLVTPLAFGRAYAPSIVPAMILLLGGALWAEQNLLVRARTARGVTTLQLFSYTTTLLTMVILDLLLIPIMGIEGAAIASVIASALGLAVCIGNYRPLIRSHGLPWRRFIPALDDFRFVSHSVTRLARTGRWPSDTTR